MSVRELPLVELARRCREETFRFLRGEGSDERFCFEIFQQAVVGRNDDAWEAILGQYRGIVLAYVSQHTAAATLHEPEDYWINRAFQRFWSAVTAERFNRFPDLAALLKYLKLCVHSVLMDEVRARRAASSSFDDLPEAAASTNAEGEVLGQLAGAQLWAAISRELQNDAETHVVYLTFAHDLKPSDIAAQHPSLFASVADVYRVKRNVMERLRHSPEIRAFLAT